MEELEEMKMVLERLVERFGRPAVGRALHSCTACAKALASGYSVFACFHNDCEDCHFSPYMPINAEAYHVPRDMAWARRQGG